MALDFLFPQRCVGCGKRGIPVYHQCLLSSPRVVAPFCPKCGRPQSSEILYPSCRNWQAEINGIRSPFRFEGAIRQAILQLKYRNLRALAAPLGQLLNSYLNNNQIHVETLVPVPLHQKRLRERGYNQASLLARELGKLASLTVVEDCITRRQHAPPQTRSSSVKERQQNVANAFVVSKARLAGKQVLLIDDVATSGATLDACPTVLKSAGAASVWGLAVAREI